MMQERKLASIRKIDKIIPIKNADEIESATIGGWNVIVRKGEFMEGDLCIYCEIDSLLPERDEFKFLANKNYRIKTIRMRGVISQGICFGLSFLIFKNSKGCDMPSLKDGVDVTEYLGIKKYVAPIPVQMYGEVRGVFPSTVPKTDESRIQNISKYLDLYRDELFMGLEKLDGTSSTFIIDDNDEFRVCSRNYDFKNTEKNLFWQIARSHDIEKKMRKFLLKNELTSFAIQGEIIGESIQSNKYKLKGHHLYLFSMFDIREQRYANPSTLVSFCKETKLNMVPIIYDEYKMGYSSVQDMISLSDGQSVLNTNVKREGLVFRNLKEIKNIDGEFIYNLYGKESFKIISNNFLLKYS